MAKYSALKKLRQVTDIRRNERQIARGAVLDASLSERRAKETSEHSISARDAALVEWQNCRAAGHIDLGLEQYRARSLVDKEHHVEQAELLLTIAHNLLEEKQQYWKLSDLKLQTAQKKEKETIRSLNRKREETKLADITDRHCFGSRPK